MKYETREIKPSIPGEHGVFDRQSLVPGFDQKELASSRALLIGAGGINGEIGEGLVRKGIGHLLITDGDIVELSNLNRQRFYEEDIYNNKALTLAKNLAKEAVGHTVIEAWGYYLQDFFASSIIPEVDVVVCGVDNDEARSFTSKYFIDRIPVVFIAVDETADHGYVFIQEKDGRPCLNCLYPDLYPRMLAGGKRKRCTPAGAVKDILKVVGGIALYAIDTLLMERRRDWNYRHVSLAGFAPDTSRWVQALPDCPVCGHPECCID